MAQRVGYFQDDVTFTEGPFVMVNANGWRIEVHNGEDHGCNCVMPALSIYALRKHLGYPEGKFVCADEAATLVDRLNRMVRDGKIVKMGSQWVWPAGEREA
jgi:hypothetical protein